MGIIRSMLDTDFYKLTMGQFVFHNHPNIPVRYAFKCRTGDVKLGEVIPEERLREELDALRELRFTKMDAAYLAMQQYYPSLFEEDYLDFLLELELPDYELEYVDGDIRLEFPGSWAEAIYWETPALAIINELYYDELMKQPSYNRYDAYALGMSRLKYKVDLLRQNPGTEIVEFGTRRRFSANWQDRVVEALQKRLKNQLLGTSNVFLARKHNLRPIGTLAHELPMVAAAMARDRSNDWDAAIYTAQDNILQEWWKEYGEELSIALTDTYGSAFFFRTTPASQAKRWRGVRHDSGNPLEFAKKAVLFYESKGINPKSKTIVFSDGLTVDEIIRIEKHVGGRIGTSYGWGTNLTNDLGPKPISTVIKASEACGYGTVKLSDNLAKATGNLEDVERFKQIFRYTVDTYEETLV